jgi:hypothetical protein
MLIGILVLAGVHVPLDCGSATPTFGDPCESLEGDEPQRGKSLETKDVALQTEDDLIYDLNDLLRKNIGLEEESEIHLQQIRELECDNDDLTDHHHPRLQPRSPQNDR